MLLVVLLSSVVVDRCQSAILWQPKSSSPCAEHVSRISDILDIPSDLDVRHQNIANLRQMYSQPLAAILYKPSMFYTFDEWLTNKQQLQPKLTEANIVTTDKQRHHQHEKHHYTKCQYTKSIPVRHARAIDLRDERTRSINKRRTAVSDLTLCHFKICNMGRKRTTRYFHTVDELAHEN
ncbi:hypothetical protein CBL_14094 [Carabus blaptoides fortunei]